MFYLVSKLEIEEINKGMEKLLYCIEHDIHDQDVFSEDQMPIVWETSRKRKECLESLKLDLQNIGRESLLRKLWDERPILLV